MNILFFSASAHTETKLIARQWRKYEYSNPVFDSEVAFRPKWSSLQRKAILECDCRYLLITYKKKNEKLILSYLVGMAAYRNVLKISCYEEEKHDKSV
jgi:hypothetical protein